MAASSDAARRSPIGMRQPFVLAAAIEVTFDVVLLVRIVASRNDVNIPGAIGRTAMMLFLAWLVIAKASRLARWCFAGFEYLAAGAMGAFAFVNMATGEPTFEPIPLALGGLYLVIAVLASMPARPPARRGSESEGAA